MRATGYPRKAMVFVIVELWGVILFWRPIFIIFIRLGNTGCSVGNSRVSDCRYGVGARSFCEQKKLIHFDSRYSRLKVRVVAKIFSIGMSPF